MEPIWNFFSAFWTLATTWDSWLVVYFYRVPAVLYLIYSLYTWIDLYRTDLKHRRIADLDSSKHYSPKLQYGDLVVDILIAVIPVMNVWRVVIELLFPKLGDLIEWFWEFLDKPLVAPRKKKK